jgi:hypothetical protein
MTPTRDSNTQTRLRVPLYLTARSIPELTHVPPAERRRILRRCAPMTYRHWQAWAALFVSGVCVGLGAYVGWVASAGRWGGPWVGAVIGAAIGGGVLGQVKGALVRPYVRAELRSQPVTTTNSA